MHWILNLEGEVHLIWVLDKRPSRMQGNLYFSEVGRGGQQ